MPKDFFMLCRPFRQLYCPSKRKCSQKWYGMDSYRQETIPMNPRFGYRGLMVDAPLFRPKENLLRIIDCMGMLKLNTLHLHLTDDNGWRIEIKISVADRNRQAGWSAELSFSRTPWNSASGWTDNGGGSILRMIFVDCCLCGCTPDRGDSGNRDAGTQQCSVGCLSLLACPVVDKFIGVLPGLGGNHADIIYCRQWQCLFFSAKYNWWGSFALFPSNTFIWVVTKPVKPMESVPAVSGAYEERTEEWRRDLQGYFMADEQLCEEQRAWSYGLGWTDEYQDSRWCHYFGWVRDTGRLHWRQPDRDIVLWWLRHVCCTSFVIKVRNGLNRSLISAIIHWKIYMTTVNRFRNEAGRRKCVHCWWVYRDPCGLSSATSPKRWNILSSPSGGSGRRSMDFSGVQGLGQDSWRLWIIFTGIFDVKGITVCPFHVYPVQSDSMDGSLQVSWNVSAPDVEIRYTTNGSQPTAKSSLYERKWQVTTPQIIKALLLKTGKQMGQTLTLPIQWNKATAKTDATQQSGGACDGEWCRSSLKYTDSKWRSRGLGMIPFLYAGFGERESILKYNWAVSIIMEWST